MTGSVALRRYHAATWDEPVVLEMGRPGSRGWIPPASEPGVAAVGVLEDLVPAQVRREVRPSLPELSEFEVLRHYLHLSQKTLGMMGVSLFGTCTMKYNPPRQRAGRRADRRCAELHPRPARATRCKGVLEVVHRLDLVLRELSGMDRFVFQPGGGADAAYTHACVTRAYHAARGELGQRDEVITTIQAHPCNSATAAAAGFEVITLPMEERRLPVAGRAAAPCQRPHRGADGQQPGRHGDLQPATSSSGWRSSTRPAGCASTTTRTSTA